CGLINNYTQSDKVQVVRIPRFNNLTVNAGASITPTLWDGQTGGVVGLEVDATANILAGGAISASGAGFRGGELDPNGNSGQSDVASQRRYLGSSDPIEGSEKGESIFGYHTELDAIYSRYGIGAAANGGGGGGYQNAGGGGGSNIQIGGGAYSGQGNPIGLSAIWNIETAGFGGSISPGGGRGGYALSQNDMDETTVGPNNTAWGRDTRKSNGGWGGHPLTYDATRIFFGGGGGAGDQDSDEGGAGGRGGGIVFITNYGSMIGNGTIEANGEVGQSSNPANLAADAGNIRRGNDGAGGGGAGGALYIENATALPATISLNAIGGDGGNQNISLFDFGPPFPSTSSEAAGPGGSGSGGAIAIASGGPAQSVVGGTNGVTTSSHMVNFTPNGATAGSTGAASLSAPYYDITATDVTICSGSTIDLTATILGTLPGGASIQWYTQQFGGASIYTGITYTTPALTATTTYYVGICPGTFRIPVVVTVTASPNLTITNPAAVCAPGTTDITLAAVTAGSDIGTLTYWTDLAATTTLASPTTVGNGTYYIQLDIGGGCTSVQAVNVVVTPFSTLTITDPTAVCSPSTADLTAAAVTAGSDAGTLSYWTDPVATAVLASPATASNGTYYIKLDVGGCTSVQPVNVSVAPSPNLLVTAPAAVCAPSTVDITLATVTAGSDAGTLTYWTDPAVTTALATPTAVGTGTYYIQLDVGGCTSVQPVNATVTLSPNLVVTNPGGVCSPSSVDLTAASITAGSDIGTLTYWTDPAVTVALAGSTTATTGTYYIRLDIGGGCTSVQPVNVTVNPLPSLMVNNPAAVCSPSTVDITMAAVTAGSDVGALTYSTDLASIATFSNPTTTGNGTYYIQLDAGGCTSVQPVNVSVISTPNLVVTDPTGVCSPSTADITVPAVTVGSDVGVLTYWTDQEATSVIASPATVGTGTFYIQLDASGCTAVEPVNVLVNPLPIVDAGGDQAFCDGQPITLSATGAQTYSWDNNITDGVVFTQAAGSNITYTVIGTDANGCVATDDVTITVEDASATAFVADEISGCAPLTVNFTNVSPGNLTDCIWNIEGGAVLTDGGSVSYTFEDAGTYDVTLTMTTITGCELTVTYEDYIYVEADPVASFTQSSTDLTSTTVVDFNNTSSGAVNYVWSFGVDGTTTTVENPSYNFSNDESGSSVITLIAYSPLGCVDTATNYVKIVEPLIYYAPNSFTPDGDEINQYFKPVFTSGYDPYDFNLKIFNRWGDIVWESQDDTIGWDGTNARNGRQVQDGTYTWKIEVKTLKNDERKLIVGHVNVLR
ncbi:MAG: gliding motility-associated C-terminal domain-containing protein, partial [Crocinitomicaceae bacterium]|nr:gliding motility-associated C-terminal domain-containing protein [Crocinitomicaceae bacterium]